MSTPADIETAVKAQGDKVRRLKANKDSSKEEIDAAVKKLLELKQQLPSQPPKAEDPDEAARKKEENVKKKAEEKLAARAKKKAAKEGDEGKTPVGGEGKKPAPAPGTAGNGPATAKPVATSMPGKVTSGEMLVRHHSSTPPVLAFIAAKLSKLTVHFSAHPDPGIVLSLPNNGGTLIGDATIARYLSRRAAGDALSAYSLLYLQQPADDAALARAALRASLVDEWLDRAAVELGPKATAADLSRLDAYLEMRCFVVPPAISIADGAVFAALSKCPAWEKAKASAAEQLPNLHRWFSVVAPHPAMSAASVAYLGGERREGSFDIELPGAVMGQVCTRFPPEPSGFLHIGHAKAALLNQYFATEWKGKVLLRFDDTNPSKEKGEYEAAIVDDVQRLGLTPAQVTHTSDYFDDLIKAQTAMIERGGAFVDPRPQEEVKADRLARRPSPYRDASVADNLRLWKEMQLGTEEGLKCSVRAKMDPASDNGTLRDPTTFRCNLTPHHMVGTAYKVFPTYDFACPFVDALEGVTHALRDRQYVDRDEQYVRMCDLLEVRRVNLWSFSRINFKRCLLSKRKLTWFVDTGRVQGWDDPRMPTIQGILRRGLTVEGLRTFILLQGASQANNLMEWEKLWAENRKVIDPTSVRYTAITAAGAVPVDLRGEGEGEVPAEPEARSLPCNKKNLDLGTKLKWYSKTIILEAEDAALLKDGEEVTLMDWGNAVIEGIDRAKDGTPTRMRARLHLSGDVKKTKYKLTWVASDAANVPVRLVDIDHLITKDSLEEEDALHENAPWLNNDTMMPTDAIGEPALRMLQKSQIIQIERRGFYICDQPAVRPSDPIVLFFVPDGKNKFGYKRS